MKRVLVLAAILSLPAFLAAAQTASSGGGVIVSVQPDQPVPPPGEINPGGPMVPAPPVRRPSPPVVHCMCLRLVGDHAVPCCP